MKYSLMDITSLLGSVDTLSDQRSLRGISIDSRNIEEGMLFWALKGDRFDGHDFVRTALDKGACAAVVENHFTLPGYQKLIHVEDPLKSMQNLATQYRQSLQIPVIAITGTNGKTTTKEMLVSILSTEKITAMSKGNFNNHIGLPLSLLSWPEDAEIGVLEMGMNHLGEIRELCQIARPTHGVITNIGKGHLEFLKDEAGVARAKGELLEYLNGKGMAFLNGEDEWLIAMQDQIADSTLYGFSENCHIQGSNLESGSHSISFSVQDESIRIPVIGEYNACNAMAAISVARHFNISWDHIRQGLEQFEPVRQRMQILQFGHVQILNDAYNANPSSMKKALMTLSEMNTKGRKIAVLGDMAELGDISQDEHIKIGRLVYTLHLDGFQAYGPFMKSACDEAKHLGLSNTNHFDSHQKLVRNLLDNLMEEDVILVKGSRSSKMETVISELQSALNREGE